MQGCGCLFLLILFFICCAYPKLFWLFIPFLIWSLASADSEKNNEHNNIRKNNIEPDSYSAPISNLSKKQNMQFINNDDIELYGYKITNPMIYISNYSDYQIPFMVSNNTKVEFGSTNNNEKLNYWPSFTGLTSLQKGIFIKWLASGKKDPDIDIGYVFIYYYGLEYRALKEQQNLEEILFELIRLAQIYHNHSFQNYSLSLISYLIYKIKYFSEEKKSSILNFIKNIPYGYYFDKESLILNLTGNISFDYDSAVKKLIYNDNRFNIQGRKKEIFVYYLSKIIDGFKDTNLFYKKSVQFNYYQASSMRFNFSPVEYYEIVPSDAFISIYRSCKKKWNSCRFPNSIRKFDGTTEKLCEIEKYILLPEKLKKETDHPMQKLFNTYMENQNTFTIKKLIELTGIKFPEKHTITHSKFLVDCYESAGYAIEPDARVLNKPYNFEQKVKVFKPEKIESQASLNYLIPAIYLDCGFQIALEDTKLLDIEKNYIIQYVFNNFALTSSAKERLKCKAELIEETQDITTSDITKKLLSRINDINLEKFCKYLISVAASDNMVQPEEYKLLKKYFKKLGLADDYLDRLLNEITSEDNIIVKSPSSKTRKGSKIPIKPTESKIQISLNKEKISDLMVDTKEIQNVLNTIFEEESQTEAIEITSTKQNVENNDTIDERYLEFAKIILEKEEWETIELKNICKNLKLMLNNAIDKINEWTDNEFGDFLIENNGNKINLNSEIMQAVQSNLEK